MCALGQKPVDDVAQTAAATQAERVVTTVAMAGAVRDGLAHG